MDSGCEMYRVKMPFHHLRETGLDMAWVPAKELSRSMLDHFDLLVLPRLGIPEEDAEAIFLADVKRHDLTLVYEIDDDLLDIPAWNPSKINADMRRAIGRLMGYADLVTVTNPYLGRKVRRVLEDQGSPDTPVTVLPNCVDPEMWEFEREPNRKVKGLTVGVHGGNSHVRDWMVLVNVFRRLAERYPDVTFVTGGYCPPYFDFLGERLVKIPWVPYSHLPRMAAQIDIAMCPLEDHPFNHAKSPIKWMESTMAGAACVVSPTVYGPVVGSGASEMGDRLAFVARDEDDWVRYASRLIEKPRLRREMAQRARGWILRHLNIHELAPRWMAAYRAAWQRKATS